MLNLQSFMRLVPRNMMRQSGNSFSNFVMPCTTLTSDETMLQETVTSFAQTMILPKVSEMDAASRMCPDVLSGLFQNGLLAIEIPEQFGGAGMSFMNVVLAIEALSKVDPSIGLLVDLQNTVVNNVLVKYGTPEQQEKYLPRLSTDTIGSFCLSENASGSDAFALKTTASVALDDKEMYEINGSKSWISNVGNAGVFLVFANVDLSLGYKGITCFIVDRDMEGLEIAQPEDKLGIRASSTCGLSFSQLRVPKSNILGEIGKGYQIAISTLNEGRIGIASQMLGLAQGAFDCTMPYLFERHQFGQKIGDFQAVQHQYAQLAVDIESTRLMVYNAARLKDSGANFVKEAAMAKLQASVVAERTASKCIELCGGIGFTKDFPLEKFYRDAKIGSIYEGTSNMQLSTIAKLIRSEYVQ